MSCQRRNPAMSFRMVASAYTSVSSPTSLPYVMSLEDVECYCLASLKPLCLALIYLFTHC